MQNLKAHFTIILWTVLFNFYILVLYFAAERLKFAFLFFAITFCAYFVKSLKNYKMYFTGVLSILSHVQILAFIAAFLSKNIFTKKSWREITWLNIAVVVLTGIGVIFFLHEHIYYKIQSFFLLHEMSLFTMAPIMLLLLLSFRYSDWQVSVIYAFLPLIIGVLLIGGDRLNMMGYFVFLFYACQYNRGINVGLIALNGYFTYKSYLFFEKILEQGNGFT